VLRRSIKFALIVSLICGAVALENSRVASGQEKTFTAEQVAESVIAIYGGGQGRIALSQIRRNGLERGKATTVREDGRTEESNYERRFVRGENSDKDKIRFDHKSPTLEYALIFNGGHTWGIMNGASFQPRQEAADNFMAQQRHGLDTLLRYKENGSTLTMLPREKQKGLDLYVLDVTDKEKQRTRYYISTRTAHVLWLEYEGTGSDAAKPIKYMKKFADYRYAQGTLVPYRTVSFEDGKQTQETRIMTITYGVKMEDALFKNPDTQTSAVTP
jgi:hypothetical protein